MGNRQVAYNSAYGGFEISELCLEWLCDHGNETALSIRRNNQYDSQHGMPWTGTRHDPMLILAIETLGNEKASGPVSSIFIHQLNGDRYVIQEYDGLERVLEPGEIEWVSIS